VRTHEKQQRQVPNLGDVVAFLIGARMVPKVAAVGAWNILEASVFDISLSAQVPTMRRRRESSGSVRILGVSGERGLLGVANSDPDSYVGMHGCIAGYLA
jgi:hypothetical protein